MAAALTPRQQLQLSPRKQLQVDYWGELRRLMWSRDGKVRPRKPPAQYYQTFAIGKTQFGLLANFHVDKNYVSAALMLTGEDNKAHFALLYRDKEEIEKLLDNTLYWDKKPHANYCAIGLSIDNCDLENRDTWPDLLKWQYEKLEDLHRVFAPRIKTLDASDYIPDETDLEDTEDGLV